MQKFSTNILEQDVPEEEVEATQEEDQSSFGHKDDPNSEPVINSLFSFNFLNEDVSPKSSSGNQKEDELIDSTLNNEFEDDPVAEAQQAYVEDQNLLRNRSDEPE